MCVKFNTNINAHVCEVKRWTSIDAVANMIIIYIFLIYLERESSLYLKAVTWIMDSVSAFKSHYTV